MSDSIHVMNYGFDLEFKKLSSEDDVFVFDKGVRVGEITKEDWEDLRYFLDDAFEVDGLESEK